MGHTVENGINQYIKEAAGKDYAAAGSGRYRDNRDALQGTGGYGSASAADMDAIFGCRYTREEKADAYAGLLMESFDAYLQNRQEKAAEAGEDAASRERQEKEAAKEIARSLTGEEIRRLERMGIDVESAVLSDIMGLVNTMRGNAHREQTAELLAQILAKDGTDGLTLVGGSVKAAGTDVSLDSVSVSDVVAADIKAEQQEQHFTISNDELIYLIKNNLQLTKENICLAHYSGSRAGYGGEPPQVPQDMLPQIERIIERSGYTADDRSMEGIRLLMSHKLPVTADSVKTYMEYQSFVGQDIGSVSLAEDMSEILQERAAELYHAVNDIQPLAVYEMTMQNREVTIASAVRYMQTKTVNPDAETNSLNDRGADEAGEGIDDGSESRQLQAVTAMRRMEEIRLSMTLEAAGRLVRSDINIDTRELSKVVTELQDMEKRLLEYRMRQSGVAPTEENTALYMEVSDKVRALAEAPASVIAAPLSGAPQGMHGAAAFTINVLYEKARTLLHEDAEEANVRAEQSEGRRLSGSSFETVRRSYEAVGTAPRADMGDSISKAFSNVDDILRELDMPVSYETERAVRILGYNSLEITAENIEQIMDYDRQVNELMDTFYPEAVLSMIRDGINPMDVPINELNQRIREKNYNAGVTEADNYAAYLRDMERQGAVSPEERESYIGIYRVMERLAKSGDREAGYLFANAGRLTIRNLISAMRSRKASGLDVAVNDAFGMLETADVTGSRMDVQIEKAFAELDADARHRQAVPQPDAQSEQTDAEDISDRLQDMDEQTEQFMEENRIAYTMVNASAVHAMLQTDGGLYALASEILARLTFTSGAKDALVDEETEHMSDSLSGEEIPVEFTTESILESLRGSEEMSLKYEDLRDRLTELLYDAGGLKNIPAIDIRMIKTVQAGYNILSHMAKSDSYQIPVRTAQGTKVMNLKVVHDGRTRGQIELRIAGQMMGEVSARIRLDENSCLEGFIVSSTSEGNYILKEQEEQICGGLSEEGFAARTLTLGSIAARDNGGLADIREKQKENAGPDASVKPERLYQASVALVKIIGAVLC